jgi:hypothetical protein
MAGKGAERKIYTKDGQSFTIYYVMKQVGCAWYTARYRLERWVSNKELTVEWLFRPLEKIGLNGKRRGTDEFLAMGQDG